MSFSKFKEIQELNEEDLKKELLVLKKELFNLRVQKATRQKIQPHVFTHIKHRISQISCCLHQKQTT